MCRGIVSFLRNVLRNHFVLDVRCRAGKYRSFLKKIGFTEVVGIDLSYTMLRWAERRVPLVCCSAFNMPFRDKSFYVAFSTAVLEHVPDPIGFIRRLTSVLNGWRLFIYYDP
jgi:ubiquinone/menaquinone biosynthesis C-methylase UbiE